ncbi:MAG: 3-deoxy-7-phosphoheptulonate synthase, partial [Gammaproteobacteria bacterium]
TTSDLHVVETRPLLAPALLHADLPIDPGAADTVASARRRIQSILSGEDRRMLVIVGPCSVHDVDAAREYARRLAPLRERHINQLEVVMRVYFEKPRTTVGWKGLINDPHLDGTFDINNGLRAARRLLLELANRGIPAGSEFLDVITPQFIADLIAWGAIGARTTESQIHRELASGSSMPIGFKNGTDGSVQIAIDAIGAAQHPHHFLSVTKQSIAAIVSTAGNDTCHLILRGSNRGPNYDAAAIAEAAQALRDAGLRERLMVDCSHGNSRKDHKRQPEVAASLCEQLAAGSHNICGVMLESHLKEGKQNHADATPLVYGQSITDACMSWEMTAPVLRDLAAAVRARRSRSA